MNKIIGKENVENMIYEISGCQVMLDSDLAKLYQVETKRINEAVNRNNDKFPKRFTWIVSKNELDNLWSQNATANISPKSRTNPRVFTEQGIYMLATILKSKVATEVSIAIMDTFVKMRHYIDYNSELLPNKILLLEKRVDENTKMINKLFKMFNPNKLLKEFIFYDGKYYDAYSKICEIFNEAKKELIIIDSYADLKMLDIIKKVKVKVILITTKKCLTKQDIDAYNKQYNNLTVIYNDTFHDRFFIVNKKKVYHCGTSFNRMGNRTFSINELSDAIVIKSIIDSVEKINN